MKKLTLPLLLCFALPGASLAEDVPELYENPKKRQRRGHHYHLPRQSFGPILFRNHHNRRGRPEPIGRSLGGAHGLKRCQTISRARNSDNRDRIVHWSSLFRCRFNRNSTTNAWGGVIIAQYHKHHYFYYRDFLAQIENGSIEGEGEVLAFKAFIENPDQVLQKLKAQPFPDMDQFDPATLSP